MLDVFFYIFFIEDGQILVHVCNLVYVDENIVGCK